MSRNKKTINEYLSKGCQLIQKGDLKQAEEHFLHIIHLQPDYDLAYFLMGLTAQQAGKFDEAVKFIEKAISINPAVETYYYHLGNTLLEVCRIDEAVIAYQKATSFDPHYSKTLFDKDLLQYLDSAPEIANNAKHKERFCCFSFPKCGTNLLNDIVLKVTGLQSFWPETTTLTLEILKGIPHENYLIGHFTGNTEVLDFLKKNGYRIIVNYRDPRDQLISFYYYYTNIEKKGDNEWGVLLRKFTKEQAINVLTTTYLAGGVAHPSKLALWLGTLLEFKRRGIPVLFITYEDLVMNKLETVRKIADFLGYKLPVDRAEEIETETSFKKRLISLQGKGKPDDFIKRKGIVGDWHNHFTQSNKNVYNAVAGQFLTQMGYELCSITKVGGAESLSVTNIEKYFTVDEDTKWLK